MKKKKKSIFKRIIVIIIIIFIAKGVLNQIGDDFTTSNDNGMITQDNSSEDQDAASGSSQEESAEEKTAYYYYNILTEDYRKKYIEIYNGIMNFDKKIMIGSISNDDLTKLVDMILSDHPEIFWLEGSYSYTNLAVAAFIAPNYTYDSQSASSKQADIENAESEALAAINDYIAESREEYAGNPAATDDFITVKAVYDYVINNTEYQKDVPDDQNLYSALVGGQTVCAGYAKETQYLLQKLGIQAVYVSGNVTESGPHAWNVVKCGDYYYNVDTTYGDRNFSNVENSESMPEILKPDYLYLCCTDSFLYSDRTSDDKENLPECSMVDLDYYRISGLYFQIYDDTVIDYMVAAIKSGQHYWQCRFSDAEPYNTMMNRMKNDNLYADMILRYSPDGIRKVSTCYFGDEKGLTITMWY